MAGMRQVAERVTAALLVAIPAAAQRPRTFADLRGFDQWVAQTMAEWHVPGLAIGAVRDGQVVIAKGYGYRDVETQLPVTERTVMGIGSNTKSFTVVLMGMMVDEKKFAWDVPLRTYLTDFELKDEFATREMTPRDLVTHRSGLPRHDNLWYGRPFSREELYRRLRYLEPTYSFRSRYQYQNLMFMTAGSLVERVSGRGWDELIRDRIFNPLGMVRSNTTVRESPNSGDFAFPYTWRSDSLIRLPFRNIDAIGPAGSINSSVDEMLKYIQFRLDSGVVGGRRLLSADNERQMQSPQMVTLAPVDFPELGHAAYGMGLGVSTYRGRKIVSHGGGIDGFISAMSWLPDERIGIVVLSNLSGNNPVPTMVMRTLADRLLAAPPVDWVARQRKTDADRAARQATTAAAREAERKPGTNPSHPLPDYTGSFEHPGYGTVRVALQDGNLSLTLEPHTVRLRHFHYDAWEFEDPGGAVPFGGRLRFWSSGAGEIDRVAVSLEPAGADIVFVRSRP